MRSIPDIAKRRRVASKHLLPVMSASHNLREICKQSLLLEDHLNHPEKRCPDCIRKHFLCIEALYEEGITLSPNQRERELLEGKPELLRMLQARWQAGEDPCVLAALLRKMRKVLTAECWHVGLPTLARLASACPHGSTRVAKMHLAEMTNAASRVLMKWLARETLRLGLADHTYVVGGAVRNFVLDPSGKRLPIKDVDLVIDSVAARKDSEWLGRELIKAIPAKTNMATNNYGVALLKVLGDWVLDGHQMQGNDIEIANARTESYTDGGYTPDDVAPSTIHDDILRRDFSFNTLLWRMYDLADGPDKAPIIDLAQCGVKDLENGVMRCPADPDKTFKDDPRRMIRAVKFLVKYGFKLSPDTKASIIRNKARLKNIPHAHLSNMLINTFLRDPSGKKALLEMGKLGLLDEIKEIALTSRPFREALANWSDKEAKVEFIFDLMDLGLPAGKRMGFLDRNQQALVRDHTVQMSHDDADRYVQVLAQPGKVLDTRALMAEFDLKGSAVRQLQEIARDALLSNPSLVGDPWRLTQHVGDALRLTIRTAAANARAACVIAVGKWGKGLCLVKNRDRNYKPEVKIVHEEIDGVEIAYLLDLGTDWSEGMNEYGVGVVNSALLVGRDEAEKKLVKTIGKKSQDGQRIRAALSKKKLKAVIDAVCSISGGVKGHTFVADAKKAFSVEQTSKHDCVVKEVSTENPHARTNHGFNYGDAGYTEGEDYLSSVIRRDNAEQVLRQIDKIEGVAPALVNRRNKDRADPNNIVRKTDNISTNSQMVLDLEGRRMLLYLLPGQVTWKGVDNRLPGGRKPKIKAEVYRYRGMGKDKVTTTRLKTAGPASASRIAGRHLAGDANE